MQIATFSRRLADAFRQHGAPSLEGDDRCAAAVVEIRHDAPGFGLTGPLPDESAHLLCLYLADIDRIECWQDKRSHVWRSLKAGDCTVHDLRRSPFIGFDEPFHLLALRLPDATRPRADAGASMPVEAQPAPIQDPVLAGLVRSLLPFLDARVTLNRACVDHVLQAIGAQASIGRGGARPMDTPPRGGLAPWQQRRAQELLRDHLTEGISLKAVAEACSLSASGFLRAFRQSVGVPPHQWLLRCRVDRATELLRDRQLSLCEIALSAGFFDQSHFTRVFSQRMGLSPGAWRKAQAGAA